MPYVHPDDRADRTQNVSDSEMDIDDEMPSLVSRLRVHNGQVVVDSADTRTMARESRYEMTQTISG